MLIIKDYLTKYKHVKIDLSGNDLIDLGIPKGPEIKKTLDKLLKAKLDGIVHNKNDEILFIKKEYQRSNLHLGSNLLKYILKNKQIIENYFQTNFYYSYLDTSKNNEQLFLQLGYQEKNFLMYKNLGHK